MTARGRRRLGIALVAVVVALALVPILTGRPILSYPVSRSMEPTIGPFDVYLVDPFPGRLSVGDIVVFESQTQGGPAVHRIVGGNADDGWITKGDNNANVDQLGAEPPVVRDRVLGRVVVGPDGEPILLRGAGVPVAEAHARYLALARAAGGPEKLASFALLGLAAALMVPALLLPRSGARPAELPARAWRRWMRRAFPRGILGRHVAAALLVLLVASAGWGMQRAHVDAATSLIVVDDPTVEDPVRTVVPGHGVDREIEVSSLGFLPTLVVLDPGSPGIVTNGAHGEAAPYGKVALHVLEVGGDELGLQRDVVSVWRYPDVMPDSWTLGLHAIMPGLPFLVLAGLVALVGGAWYLSMDVARKPVGPWLGLKEGWL